MFLIYDIIPKFSDIYPSSTRVNICYHYIIPSHPLFSFFTDTPAPRSIYISRPCIIVDRTTSTSVCIRWYNCTFSKLSTLSNQWHFTIEFRPSPELPAAIFRWCCACCCCCCCCMSSPLLYRSLAYKSRLLHKY